MKLFLNRMQGSSTAMTLKWAIMTATIFWTIVFKLSELGVKLPEFVYVNF